MHKQDSIGLFDISLFDIICQMQESMEDEGLNESIVDVIVTRGLGILFSQEEA